MEKIVASNSVLSLLKPSYGATRTPVCSSMLCRGSKSEFPNLSFSEVAVFRATEKKGENQSDFLPMDS